MVDDPRKMVVLLIQLMQTICHTGTYEVLDSGFCVLKGITELQWRGVYDGVVIKKRRYCPNHIPAMNFFCTSKEIPLAM